MNVGQIDAGVLMNVLTQLWNGEVRRQREQTIEEKFFGTVVRLVAAVGKGRGVDSVFVRRTIRGRFEGEIEAMIGRRR